MADVNILEMDIPPYLSRESSKFDEMWYTNPNFDTAEETWQT